MTPKLEPAPGPTLLAATRARSLTSRLIDWFYASARDLPWRYTLDPYAIWVAEVMLQQTQVKTTIPYWTRWMKEFPDLRRLAGARPDAVLKLWEGLGYYSRARNLQKAAQELVKTRAATFPTDFAEILRLPGVGRYTAGAIASIAFNQPQPVLDGNVIRVFTRLFGIAANPRETAAAKQLWTIAALLVQAAAALPGRPPPRRASPGLATHLAISGPCSALNQALMELGATVCTPRQPRCDQCPVRLGCIARRTGQTGLLPNLERRPPTVARRFRAFLVEHRGKWLVHQRPAGTVNAQLWEFPNLEITAASTDPRAAAEALLGSRPTGLQPFLTVRHSITRYSILLEAHLAVFRQPPRPAGVFCWLAPDELEQLAYPSAHRRLLHKLLANDIAGLDQLRLAPR